MIELKNISVIYGKGSALAHELFKDLSLSIKPQEFVTVIGGNGAGKSTLMNIISGDVCIDTGSLWLDEKEVTGLQPYERASLISRVFQDPLLGSYADLSIEENLSVAYSRGKTRGFSSALNRPLREKCRAILEDLGIGLENRLSDKMGLLSGGQRQAISLLMATLQPAKILLLDEHTAALDPKMEQLVLSLTQRLVNEFQLTALMITHCMNQALEFGTRTIIMHHGKIVRDLEGEARHILKPDELISYF